MLRCVALALFASIMTVAGSNAMAIEMHPVAVPAAIVEYGKARFTILTSAMIRLEWSSSGEFEDRASFAFINRRLPTPEFDVVKEQSRITITTDDLMLTYDADGGRFNPDNLSITLATVLDDQRVTWRPGTPAEGNLRGTARTLDGVSGSCPLESGLLSRAGWALVDDSARLLFDGADPPWVAVRKQKDAIDWYFFGYGRDYLRALRDFSRVAGRIPLPPRYAFGAWWSRYWAYTDAELKSLVAEHRENDVPLDVLVIDMDWHLAGWTGYTWDPERFPDPAGFLKWVDDQGLETTLNLHPHDGVGDHEAMFEAFAKAVGRDLTKTDRIPFDGADPQFMQAYFELLHHPYERMGVDFWWIDWQQGEQTKVPGLDPLWWLNHLHWTDMERNPDRGDKRPLIFSRWGGLGNHRYPIGFSGDTYCNWSSLAFQPYFTATAGNVGFAYWSHDIGGHQPGPVDPELYTRWVQFGALSPALRTHTTKNPAAERRIWKFPEEHFQAMRDAFHLRYELLPYIYTAARQCYDNAVPLCRPLYYHWPDLDEAYQRPGQYMLGDDLLVSPVTAPANEVSGYAEAEVWLPPGMWVNWFAGTVIEGPRVVMLQLALDEFPLFARGGAIIPAMPRMRRTDARPVDPLILQVMPGASGVTGVYEDDGVSAGYKQSAYAWTPVEYGLNGVERQVTIGPAIGSFPGMPEQRGYEVRFRDVPPPYLVTVDGERLAPAKDRDSVGWYYDPQSLSAVVRLGPTDVARQVDLRTRSGGPDWSDFKMDVGLRGVLRRLDDVASMLSIEESTKRAEARRQLQASSAVGKLIDAAREDWVRLLEAIASGVVDQPARPLARLLNLGCRTEATARGAGETALALRTTVTVQLPFEQFTPRLDLAADIHLDTALNWRYDGKTEWHCPRLSSDESAVFETLIVPDGPPQTTILSGTLKLRGVAQHAKPQGVQPSAPGDNAESELLKIEDLPEVSIRKVLLPSINRWWIVGPFDAPSEARLQEVFPPEREIDLKATYTGKDHQRIRWKRVERSIADSADLTEEHFIEFHKVLDGYQQNAVAYALTWLHAPREMDAVLAIGSDDGNVVWLDGEEVFRHDVGRPYQSKEDHVSIRLKEGANKLLVKVSQGGGMWGFCVHVETAEGEPVPEITALLAP